MPIALAANALTTLETASDELNVGAGDPTVDSRIARMINVASAMIESYCDRSFGKAARTERYRGYGSTRLYLRAAPIDTTQPLSIVYLGATIDPSEYTVSDGSGVLIRTTAWNDTAGYARGASYEPYAGSESPDFVVTYTGGYVLPKDGDQNGTRTLPYDLEQVCLELVATKYAQRGKDRTVTSESLLSWSASYGGATSGDITESMQQVLGAYRRVA